MNSDNNATVASHNVDKNINSNILHLNDYCLKRIFMYSMTQEQLLIIATVDPRFAVPTKLVFREKFSQKLISVSNDVIGLLVNGVNDPDARLVQCFGDEIKKLNISMELDNGCEDKLEGLIAAVSENCGTNLIKMRILHQSCSQHSILYQQGLKIVQPFAQKLSTKFQNLKCLDYEDYEDYENCLSLQDFIQHLPHLTRFSFVGNLSLQNIQNFIELNRKLEYLRLKSKSRRYLNYDFIAFLDTMLPQLNSLELLGFYWNAIDAEKANSIAIQFDELRTLTLEDKTFSALICPESLKCLQLKNLKTLSVNTHSWSWSLNQISNLILCNDQLSSIEFTYTISYDSINYDESFSDSSDRFFLNIGIYLTMSFGFMGFMFVTGLISTCLKV